MKQKTKYIVAGIGLILLLLVAFLAYNNRLFIGPVNSDGYIINNDPYNKWIRYLATAGSFSLFWYLVNKVTKDKALTLITVVFFIPIFAVIGFFLSIRIYGLGG